jgi:Tfp pilus assembly protein PilX
MRSPRHNIVLRNSRRRGVAIVAFVAALLVIGTMTLWLFQVSAATNSASLSYYYSTGAFYAAESGVEMTLAEMNQMKTSANDVYLSGSADGSISNNGNNSDDPTLATGKVFVEKTGSGPNTYKAWGRPVQTTSPWNTYRRVIQFQLQ